jgi:ubiquinone/menaquinone biosynthesis C-methylase UbiE
VYGVSGVTGDSRLQSDVLEGLSDARRYRRWLAEIALPYLGDHPIEIGSGNGDYALEWAPHVASLTATEADDHRYEALHDRFRDHPVIKAKWLLLGAESPAGRSAVQPGAQHTGAVALNVFEHIPDHVGALKSMATYVKPGGHVVIIVPAFPSAMSRFDRAIGHERRYTKATLRTLLDNAGLMISDVRYVNPIGLLAWYVAVKGLNMTPKNGLGVRLYDRVMVPVARVLDRARIAPFGQSVVGIARVPG